MPRKHTKALLRLNRALSWILLTLTIIMLSSGYIQTRFPIDRSFWMPLHTQLGYTFTVLLLTHFLISVLILRYPWKTTLKSISLGKAGSWTWIRLIQRTSAWFILATSLLMVATGLGWYSFNLWNVIPFHPHVTYDTLMAAGLAIHAATGARAAMSRNRINLPAKNALLISIAMIAILGVFYVDRNIGVEVDVEKDAEPDTLGDVEETRPVNMGTIRVGSKSIKFEPKEVETVRPDIFRPGYVSMFDVLVHVSKNGHVDLEYHFNESMNTHVIDKLEGKPSWWYYTYYNGGWRESNYFRSDHYPWKDGTVLHFIEVQPSRLEKTYAIYREEVARKEANNGRVVIPFVIIDGKTVNKKFEDVEVTAHNLRNDVFQDNIITAIDVILSLDDQEKLSYGLKWYESIGTARIVKNYWVESIDEDKAQGRCGFVYESGDQDLRGFIGNHIHLPSDTRVLNSPEYVMYFWICI